VFSVCVWRGREGVVEAASTWCMSLLRRDDPSHGRGDPMEFLFSAFIL